MGERLCEYCGHAYSPRQFNQRFCSGPCSDAWHETNRRRAVELLREMNERNGTMKPTGDTYFSRAQVDADEPGGRFTRQTPRVVTGASPALPLTAPAWSRDLAALPDEPAHNGTEESDTYGLDVSGVAGLDGRTRADDDAS